MFSLFFLNKIFGDGYSSDLNPIEKKLKTRVLRNLEILRFIEMHIVDFILAHKILKKKRKNVTSVAPKQ